MAYDPTKVPCCPTCSTPLSGVKERKDLVKKPGGGPSTQEVVGIRGYCRGCNSETEVKFNARGTR